MNDIIYLLPDHIANRITAGEVIQRPASVVKESVENAVDAGTSNIQVNIKDADRTLIQMVDDGEDMSETGAHMAFERHTTSKIPTAKDLFFLHTVGFQDEALASTATTAHIKLRIRTRGTEFGTCLSIVDSNLESIEPEAYNKGSVFSIRNLFFGAPARRKFLKSNETKFRNIVNEFKRVTLVNPRVDMSLYHNDAEIFNLPKPGLCQRIINIYGKSLNQKLLSLDAQNSMVTISDFVGRPDSAKERGVLQFFLVNGRYTKHPYFHRAIMQTYEQSIPAGDMPDYFVYFALGPSSIDVNIHPTKAEVKLKNEQPIRQILMVATRETSVKSSAIPMIDFGVKDATDTPVYNPVKKSELSTYKAPKAQVDPSCNPFDTTSHEKPEFDWSKLYQRFENDRVAVQRKSETFKDAPIGELPAEASDPGRLFVEVSNPCYQYEGRYIVTSLKSGLAIIDQHRARVYILFDQYLSNIRRQQGVSRQVLFPEVVEFTAAEAAVLPSLSEDLCFIGFDLSNPGSDNYVINGLPAGIEDLDPVNLAKDIVDRTIETGCVVHEKIREAIALSLTKAAAIRPGKSLSLEEMDHLAASLFFCSDSNLTPDGKTIISMLTDKELERRLKC